MASIEQILRGTAQAAREARRELDATHDAMAGVGDQAERIAGIRAPAVSPITAANRLLPPAGGGTGGGGVPPLGGGPQFDRPAGSLPEITSSSGVPESETERWVSNNGSIRLASWVRENCTPVEEVVALTSSGKRTVTAWVCPQPHGTFYPDRRDLRDSSSTSGGAGTTPGRTRDRVSYGRGISGSTVEGRLDQSRQNRQEPASGPQSTSGGLAAMAARQDETNKTLKSIDRKLSGDGGVGLRAGGLV